MAPEAGHATNATATTTPRLIGRKIRILFPCVKLVIAKSLHRLCLSARDTEDIRARHVPEHGTTRANDVPVRYRRIGVEESPAGQIWSAPAANRQLSPPGHAQALGQIAMATATPDYGADSVLNERATAQGSGGRSCQTPA
jgi:hypothetical protein